MITVLVTDSATDRAIARLKASRGLTVQRTHSPTPTPEEMANAEVLWVRSRTRVDAHVLQQCPNLKLVVTATAGFDHIHLGECQKRGIQVAYTPDANVDSTAELTMGLMFSLVRKLHLVPQALNGGGWRDERLRGGLLKGRTLGVVGLGRIGGRVAELAHKFGMSVLYYDPYIEPNSDLPFERLGLTELLTASDVITLHVPLTRETKHLINHHTLPLMAHGAMIINASRGSIIDESELLVALDQDRIGGVALDVFEKEPLARDSRLRGRENVILSPHIGAFTQEALEAASMAAAEKILDFTKGSPISDTLPLTTPWFDQVLSEN